MKTFDESDDQLSIIQKILSCFNLANAQRIDKQILSHLDFDDTIPQPYFVIDDEGIKWDPDDEFLRAVENKTMGKDCAEEIKRMIHEDI